MARDDSGRRRPSRRSGSRPTHPRSGSLPLSSGRSYGRSHASRGIRGPSAPRRSGPRAPRRGGDVRPLRLGEKTSRVPQLKHVQTSSRIGGPSYTRARRPSLSSIASRLPFPPAVIIAAVAGLVLVALIISSVVGCVMSHAQAVGRALISGGDIVSDTDEADTTYAAGLLLPDGFAPRSADGITVTGTRRRAADALGDLAEAVEAIRDGGHSVGFVLRDLRSGIAVSYNANRAFNGASSIKGPYVVSAVRYDLGDGARATELRRIANIITDSDNHAYSQFRNAYGDACFDRLLSDAGLDGSLDDAPEESDGDISNSTYEYYTPNQLVAMWGVCRDYLASDEPGAAWLGTVFETPVNSAIRVTAGSIGTTWSKPGWYPGEGGDLGTTVDGGVLRTETGDVLISAMTTSPEDFQALESIVSALVSVRTQLTA